MFSKVHQEEAQRCFPSLFLGGPTCSITVETHNLRQYEVHELNTDSCPVDSSSVRPVWFFQLRKRNLSYFLSKEVKSHSWNVKWSFDFHRHSILTESTNLRLLVFMTSLQSARTGQSNSRSFLTGLMLIGLTKFTLFLILLT